MKKTSLILMIIVSMVILSCKSKSVNPNPEPKDNNYDQDEQSLLNAGWEKVFEEDFSSDFSKWTIWKGGAYNNEYQYYSDDPSNLKISDGQLIITAKKETKTGATNFYNSTPKTFDFTSGRIECKTPISANTTNPTVRVAARIKLPTGYGMWPAFWSYGASWPTNGEIDILEARGNKPLEYATNYFYGPNVGTSWVYGAETVIQSKTSLAAYWHVYEVVWEKEKLTFYFDGEIVDTKLASSSSGQYVDELFGKVQTITLNLAVAGNYFGNPDPSTIVTGTMYVDWVKVYHLK